MGFRGNFQWMEGVPSLHTYVQSRLLTCWTLLSHWYIQLNEWLGNLRARMLRRTLSLPHSPPQNNSCHRPFMSSWLSYPLLPLCPASRVHLPLPISIVSARPCFPFPVFFLLFSVSRCYFSYAALLSHDKAVFINISRPSHQQTNSNMSDVILETVFLTFCFVVQEFLQTRFFGAILEVWELWMVGFHIIRVEYVCRAML